MKKERNNIFWLTFFPLICTSMVIILMLSGFSRKIKADVANSFQKNMQETAVDYAQKIQNELHATYMTGTTILAIIEQQRNEPIDEQATGDILQTLVDTTEIYAAEYYTEGDNAINQSGETVDLSSKEYFSAVNHSAEVQYLYINEVDANLDTILILIPNTEKTSTLLLYYPMRRVKTLAKVNKEFDQTAFSAISTTDGTVIQPGDIKSNFLQGGNLFNNIGETYAKEISNFKLRVRNKNSGCFSAEAYGEARVLVYAPLGINDWTLILGVNQSYVDGKVMQEWNDIYRMFYQLLGVILLCIVIMSIIDFFSKKRNTEKNRILQEKADTDLLTGLNNKLATERKIKEYLEEYPNSKAMMFVLDIDNFKKINDTMGHAFGDEVLRNLGKHISSNFRVTDIVGRTGGDEFTILLKNLKDDESVEREARKLVNFFKGFQVGEYVKYSATASIGAAVYPEDGTNFEALYKSADSALYIAKKLGKNQLAFSDERVVKP